MNKWDCFKLKSFCTAKEKVTRLKRYPIDGDIIFASYSSNEGVISRTQKTHPPKNQQPNEEMGT
jgi:hypothetical protein